jgi:predicted TPR repeat methyltransferase
MGNRDGAVGAFQRALELNPRYSVAEFWLGEAQRRAGRRADAIHAYEQYLELAPDGNQAEAARQALKTLKQE